VKEVRERIIHYINFKRLEYQAKEGSNGEEDIISSSG
jgi:hypothetical protein